MGIAKNCLLLLRNISYHHNMELKEVVGDLFNCPETHSLAHCISADLKMGKGIATIFKKRFEGVNELAAQKVQVGGVGVLRRDDRYVYYLITKQFYYEKPEYEHLKASLEAMRKHCSDSGVKNLAMPRIGCGLDRLNWAEVSRIIKDVFDGSNVDITIYLKQ